MKARYRNTACRKNPGSSSDDDDEEEDEDSILASYDDRSGYRAFSNKIKIL